MCRSDVVGGEFLRGAFGLDVSGSVRSQNEREGRESDWERSCDPS